MNFKSNFTQSIGDKVFLNNSLYFQKAVQQTASTWLWVFRCEKKLWEPHSDTDEDFHRGNVHTVRCRSLTSGSAWQHDTTPALNHSSPILIISVTGTEIDCLSHAGRAALQRTHTVGECYHSLTYWMLQEADWSNKPWINIGSLGQTQWLKCHGTDKWKATHANDRTNSLYGSQTLLLFWCSFVVVLMQPLWELLGKLVWCVSLCGVGW